jgi:methyl-accepting chemotaxis protein
VSIINRIQIRSIQVRIALWTGLCLFLASAFMITYAAVELRGAIIAAAEKQAIEVAESNARIASRTLNEALFTARTLAHALAAVERTSDTDDDFSREQVNLMLRRLIIENPQFTGIYTIWEPDAFDDRDAEFAGESSYGPSGRFMAYWNRNAEGDIRVEIPVGYDSAGEGSYYQCPRRTEKECIIEPYYYPVQGEDVLMTSLVVPVMVNDRFVGMVGVDVSIDFLQTLADQVDIYDGAGQMLLISHQGRLTAITGQSELIGESGFVLHDDFDEELEIIQNAERLVDFNEGRLEVYLPLEFGQTGTPWAVSTLIPTEAITAKANQQAALMVGIGVVLTGAALAILWVVAGQIAHPVREITTVARRVSEGNLDVEARFNTQDEIGTLAHAFNGMIGSLRHTIETERQAHEALQRVREEEERAALQEKVIAAQKDTLRELSTPLIPVADGVVIMPLVGALDTQRAQQVMDVLLNGVEQYRAHTAILDVTGVLVVDTQVATMLIQSAQAVRLLGARVVLTGIQPQMAQTLVQLGIDLRAVVTYSTLQAGIAHALR